MVLGTYHKEDKDGWNAGSCVKGWGAREGSRGRTSGEILGISINAYVGNLENSTDEPIFRAAIKMQM